MLFVFDSQSQTELRCASLIELRKELADRFPNWSEADLAQLWYWTPGLSTWLPLGSVWKDLQRAHEVELPPRPSLPATRSTPRDRNSRSPRTPKGDSPTEELQKILLEEASTGNGRERRQAERYNVRLKVILSNSEKTFLSYTRNVSSTGLLLEDQIPKGFFERSAELFLSSPKKNEFVAVRCTPIGQDENFNRMSFGDLPAESLEKLLAWVHKLAA